MKQLINQINNILSFIHSFSPDKTIVKTVEQHPDYTEGNVRHNYNVVEDVIDSIHKELLSINENNRKDEVSN